MWLSKNAARFPLVRLLFLAIILAVSLALRVWSLNFGLPFRYHIDEPPQVVAALNLAQGNFRIDYPPLSPNLHQVILLFLYIGLFISLRLVGDVNSPLEFANLYKQDPTAFYILARGLSVVSSFLALIALYFLVKRIRGHRSALLALIFLSLNFLDVRQAHFAKLYPLLTLFVLGCVYLSISYSQRGKNLQLIASGILSGIAIGLRYSVLTILLVPVFSIFIYYLNDQTENRRRLRKLIVGSLHLSWSIPAGIVIGTPSLLLNTQQVLSNMGVWAGHALTSEGFEGFVFTDLPTWRFYLKILEIAWGIPLLLMVLLGVGVTILGFTRQDLLVYIFPITYLAVLLLAPSASSAFARYLVPILPFFALLAADGTMTFVDWLVSKRSIEVYALALLVTAVLVAIPVLRIVNLDRLWSRPDTRTLAKNWIEANIAEGTKIAAQWHTPPLSTANDPEPSSQRLYNVEILNPFISDSRLYSMDYYRENGFDYLILSSFIYELKRSDPDEDRLRRSFYGSLDDNADLVAEFRPYVDGYEPQFFFENLWGPITELTRRERPGPTLKIYRLGENQ
jgi:hypothetical protein